MKKSPQNEDAMRIFGATGLNGSGKDEMVKYLQREYNIPYVSVGDMVREMASKNGVPPNRENLHRISKEQINKFGEEHFMRLAVQRIEQSGWETAGITGIRTPEDVRYLKDKFDDDFIVFHVFATDPRIRYERTRKRAQARDPQSYNEFLQQDRTEQNLFGMNQAIKRADYSLNNDESIEHLHDEIDRILLEQNLLIEKEEVK